MKTPRETSPYRLMQEEFRDDPWRLLVGCICLNQCSAKVARPVWEEFFRLWPTPESLWTPSPDVPTLLILEKMRKILRPLGFQNRRTDRIWRMTFNIICCPDPKNIVNPMDIYGIGKYAADSYNMFVRGAIVDDVQDKELRNYVEWAKTRSL